MDVEGGCCGMIDVGSLHNPVESFAASIHGFPSSPKNEIGESEVGDDPCRRPADASQFKTFVYAA